MLALVLAFVLDPATSVRVVTSPDIGQNDFYVGNRPPLQETPFRKLPIGAIRPEGWVRTQLQGEANGFTGHLTEISDYLRTQDNAWLSPTGTGTHGWEEAPYWLKGFGDLGYLLGDPRIKTEAQKWIDAVIRSQRADGWFGPRANLTPNQGRPDVWPNMVMLNALQTYYEYSGDSRVVSLMRNYFRWELNQPDDGFLLSYWERQRGGDNMASVFWLYNRTGDEWLLDLAKKLHRRTADWVSGVPDWHGVNFAQAFREPAEYSLLTHAPDQSAATERDYETMRHEYGEVPGGMYGADENARPGYTDPRQAAETCAMVEMMLSDEMLLTDFGDARWAERCEDVAFNSLPASMTPDLRSLHYLTAPNMPLIDARSKAPGLQNGGPMLLFNPYDHRCCQHNVSHGWPYYAEHLWLASANNGLAVALYAPSTVTARAGNGEPVTITERTEYPFRDSLEFEFRTPRPNRFPVTLRLPSWCVHPSLEVNGRPTPFSRRLNTHIDVSKTLTDRQSANHSDDVARDSYVVVDREWHKGDRIILRLPMDVRIRTWPANHDCVSVERGPLTYSLKIGEHYQAKGGTAVWPAEELLPTTPWNYGLDLDGFVRVIERRLPSGTQPFSPEAVPVELTMHARRIPAWRLDRTGLVDPLQLSPTYSNEPVEEVKLIPMGAARLRISAFPTASESPTAHRWAGTFP